MGGPTSYAFGPFRLDTAERRLLRDGELVPLTLKAFDLLQVLVENRGHLLPKEELLRRVWPDAAVEENNLTVTISALRKALDEASQFRPNGPLPLDSEEYADDLKQVKKLGRLDSAFRTQEPTRIALFWTDHDIPQWNRNLVRLAAQRGLGPVPTARMLAMAHVAGADAMIACFDAKCHYLSWRPLHAIQRADTDGNSRTQADPIWQPLRPTPNHPEYPSAHACHTTAITVALEKFFGTRAIPFSLDSLATGETRYYDRFKDVVQEVNRARVFAGFHCRNSDEDGSRLGRKVGRFVTHNFFRPLGCQRD
jgi:hypothetical protein